MKISEELAISLLQDFEECVINFNKKMRASGFNLLEKLLSTKVYGEYDKLMSILHSEVKSALKSINRGLIDLKIVKSELSIYAADF